MHTLERISYLVQKCLDETIQPHEREELFSLLQDSDFQNIADPIIIEAFRMPKKWVAITPEKREALLAAILVSRTAKKPTVYRRWIRPTAIAASLLLVLSMLYYILSPSRNAAIPADSKDQLTRIDTQTADPLANDVAPGTDKATLTLSDGSSIHLSRDGENRYLEQLGVKLVKTETSIQYIPTDKARLADHEPIYNILKVPYGGKFSLSLPDGTEIYLNAGSTLRYPIAFGSDERKVYLDGEAYFEVAKDSKRTFVVALAAKGQVAAQEIRVLGTHFNVNAYSNQGYITTLVEGSVQIKMVDSGRELILKPFQQAVVASDIQVTQADMASTLAWRHDLFLFQDEPIHSVMEKLSRWYDITVDYQDSIPEVRFWGQVSRTKNLSEVLTALQLTKEVKFSIQGKKVIVQPY